MRKSISILLAVLIAVISAVATLSTSVSAANPYDIDDVKLFLIDEKLPVHDVMPSLLIIINTDGTPKSTIDEYVEDYRARMLVCGEATIISDTLYYTTTPSGNWFSDRWEDTLPAIIKLIEKKYPDEKTRPLWRQVLLYVNNQLIEGTYMGKEIDEGWSYVYADYYNNMRVVGITDGQVGIHGSVHKYENIAGWQPGGQKYKDFLSTYGNCHVMSQTELDEWAKVWGVPKINPNDARFKPGGEDYSYRLTEGNTSGYTAGAATLLIYDNPDIYTDEMRNSKWVSNGNPTMEHHLWVKQKFITELNVDDYEAVWDFAQYPLPADKTERAKVIAKLRMNEMTWEDCDRLYGAGATSVVTTTVVTTTQAPVTTTSATTTTPATTTEAITTAPETTAVVGEEATTSEITESETSVSGSEETTTVTTSTALLTSTEAVTATTTAQPTTTAGETLAPEIVETEKSNLGVILPIALVSTAVIVTAIIIISKKRGKKS
jgi:hypothetical protein